MRCGCRMLPPPLEISTTRQNRNTHKQPPAQPCCSPQCRLHLPCCTLKRLQLTLQSPITCLGLPTHTLAGLCALWLQSAASCSGNLHRQQIHNPHKPPVQPSRSRQCSRLHNTCRALQRLHLTLQCPMTCPGLVTYTLANHLPSPAADPSAAFCSGNVHRPSNSQPP